MKQDHFPVTHTDAEWRAILTPAQYDIMRGHGTERPGSCALLYEKRPGVFACAGCGQPLFESKTKFESGTGWPSFDTPIEGAVETSVDRSLGMTRTEVHCSRCGSHIVAEREGHAHTMLRLGCLDTAMPGRSLGHIWRSDGAAWYDPKTPLPEYAAAIPPKG